MYDGIEKLDWNECFLVNYSTGSMVLKLLLLLYCTVLYSSCFPSYEILSLLLCRLLFFLLLILSDSTLPLPSSAFCFKLQRWRKSRIQHFHQRSKGLKLSAWRRLRSMTTPQGTHSFNFTTQIWHPSARSMARNQLSPVLVLVPYTIGFVSNLHTIKVAA